MEAVCARREQHATAFASTPPQIAITAAHAVINVLMCKGARQADVSVHPANCYVITFACNQTPIATTAGVPAWYACRVKVAHLIRTDRLYPARTTRQAAKMANVSVLLVFTLAGRLGAPLITSPHVATLP